MTKTDLDSQPQATPLYFPEAITENCLIFDGLTRCGKMLVAPLVSDLPGVEYAQNITTINNLPVYCRLGHLDERIAATFLRMSVGSYAYDRAVGRHLNTRRDDVYSIHRSLNAKELLARTSGGEGKDVIDRFNAEERISTFITHHHLPLADIWFKAFPKIRILPIVRHPIDICYSWNSRGWGDRWGKDPLAFSVVPEVNDEPVPWFALDFADEYLHLSPWNRIVKCVLRLIEMYDEALSSLDETRRQQVEVACFERMATDPVSELERFAAWLGTTMHPDMPTAMERERVPRQLNIEDRREKLQKMKGKIDPALLDRLLSTSAAYEAQWGLEGL